MNHGLDPTPYADINAVLRVFAGRIQAILGRRCLGMYLYGSLALGDFDPHSSDIDFLVVTGAEITAELFFALHTMHADFDRSGSPWAGKIEAAYIPLEALRRPIPTPTQYPQVEKGTALFKSQLEIGWAFQRYTLREHGVVVVGPDPRAWIDPVEPEEMRQAVLAIAEGWLEQAGQDPEWLAWVRQRDNQAFVVLTLCRSLYTLATGQVASKPAAGRWALKTLEGRWSALIERSLAGQHDEEQTPDCDVDDTLALLRYSVDRSQA